MAREQPTTENADDMLSPNEASKYVGSPLKTIYTWIKTGVGGIRLNASKLGGLWQIRRGDLDEFNKTLTANSLPENAPPVPQVRTNAEAKKRAEAAKARMRARGIPVK